MSVREYIGARYVPVFADPIEWDDTRAYEPLTIVYYQGNSYTSRQTVPVGISITNESFWALTGNYNAQIEQYRTEVAAFDGRITDNSNAIDSITENNWVTEQRISNGAVTNAKIADNAITSAKIADNAITSAKIVDGTIATGDIADNAITSAKIADGTIATGDIADNAITSAKIADGTIATGDIADNAITSAKIADGTIATGDIADNAITSAKIVDGAVTSAKIANGAVTGSDIANNTITKNKLVNDDIFLIFGDSWCNFTDHPNWSIDVNKILNCGQIINYGVGGAGFTLSSNFISTQIALANSQLSATQKANVKYVIVMAGVNDHQPYMPSNFLTSVRTALETIKGQYPNAIIQWFPTTCDPTYNNSTGPKWLFTIASFWYYISKFGAEELSGQTGNRYCFPKCGPCFYWNSEAKIEAFLDTSKLHLNEYGKIAIVNSILDGFGKLNMNYYRAWWFTRGEGRHIEVQITPTSVKLLGAYNATGDVSFGGQGERILAAMAAMQCMNMCDNNIG